MNDDTVLIIGRVVAELHVENEQLRSEIAELTRLLEQARSLAATMALDPCSPWNDERCQG